MKIRNFTGQDFRNIEGNTIESEGLAVVKFDSTDRYITPLGETPVSEVTSWVEGLPLPTKMPTQPQIDEKGDEVDPPEREMFIVPIEVLFCFKQNGSPRVDCYAIGDRNVGGDVIEFIQLKGRKMAQPHAFKNSVIFESRTRSTGMGAYNTSHVYSVAQQKELNPQHSYSSRTGNHRLLRWSLLPG